MTVYFETEKSIGIDLSYMKDFPVVKTSKLILYRDFHVLMPFLSLV